MKPDLETIFEELVRDNKSSICSLCYMYAKDSDEMEDMFQECLINLWKGLENFKGQSALSTWVYRVSLNTCISHVRKTKKRGETISLTFATDISISDDVQDHQIKALHKRIQALGPLDRAIVLMWLENMSYDEIGSIMGISARNVGVRLHRIKEQLKKQTYGTD